MKSNCQKKSRRVNNFFFFAGQQLSMILKCHDCIHGTHSSLTIELLFYYYYRSCGVLYQVFIYLTIFSYKTVFKNLYSSADQNKFSYIF